MRRKEPRNGQKQTPAGAKNFSRRDSLSPLTGQSAAANASATARSHQKLVFHDKCFPRPSAVATFLCRFAAATRHYSTIVSWDASTSNGFHSPVRPCGSF